MNRIFVIVILLSLTTTIVAQFSERNNMQDTLSYLTDSNCIVEYSIETTLPSLALLYYNDSINNVLERNYDFQLMNKKRKLEFWATEMRTIGYITVLALCGINGWLAVEYEWNLWIDIPCCSIVAMGTVASFIYLSNFVKKKADAIKVVPLTEININDDTTVGAVMYVDDMQQSKSFGVQIKKKF